MIYHLITDPNWEAALNRGAVRTDSLKTEGFIHCSTEEQLLASAIRHFEDYQRLVVLHIVEKRIRQKLKWEPSREGALFPHVYGPIPIEAVEALHFLVRDANGQWQEERP